MALLDILFGRPLASDEDKDERVGSLAGLSVFGLDALSSAAYGPEAALTVLIPLGTAGLGFSLPIKPDRPVAELLVRLGTPTARSEAAKQETE